MVIGTAAAVLVYAWFAYLIWDAYDDLSHYGVHRPLIGVLAVWLSAATSVAYLVAAVSLGRGVRWSGTLITALAVPGTMTALYLCILGATHTRQIGFAWGTLIGLGILGLFLTLSCVRAVWVARPSNARSGRANS